MTRTTANSRNRHRQDLHNQKTNTSLVAVNKSVKNVSASSSSSLGAKLHSTPTPTPTQTDKSVNASTSSSSLSSNINSSQSYSLLDYISSNKEADSHNLLLRVVKEFSDKLERIKSEFQRQVTELHELIKQLLNSVVDKQCIPENSSDADLRLDAIEREMHSNIIVIDGIPSSELSSDPTTAFNSLCSSVGIDVPSFSDIFCTKGNTSNGCGSVIIKLRGNKAKYKVLSAIRGKKKTLGQLTLRHIGVDSDQRIYAHEGLTKRNYKIFRETLKLKKKNNYAFVFTSNGRVFLKFTTESQPQYISSLSVLAVISKRNESDKSEDAQ